MKHFFSLTKSFFVGNERTYAIWAGLLLVILSQTLVGFNYFFIEWNGRFYDSLSQKDLPSFIKESLIFAIFAVAKVLISSLSKYHGRQYAMRWRLWMTKIGLSLWLKIPVASRNNVESADQRIQEDLLRFTDIFEKIFLDCINAIVTVLILIPLLISSTKHLILVAHDFTQIRAIIPDFICDIKLSYALLLSIFLYTFLGIIISNRFAKPLVKYEYAVQTSEADFRYNLVQIRDGKNILEADVNFNLTTIYRNYSKIFTLKRNFFIWQNLYDQFAFLLPFLLIGSNFFTHAITLGLLMQCRSTFNKIRSSTAYVINHYTEITEMTAISIRLIELYKNIGFFESTNFATNKTKMAD